MRDDNSERIYGSIYIINNPTLVFNVLDDYEGLGEHDPKPYLFKKEIISVFLENNTKIKTLVYLFSHSTEHLKRINSGDFIN